MTREEEIKQASIEWLRSDSFFHEANVESFEEGARWADEHPKNPWRDAKKDPPKDGEWCLFRFTQNAWAHGLYEARVMPNTAMSDYIRNGEIISWMPISELPKV